VAGFWCWLFDYHGAVKSGQMEHLTGSADS